MRAEILEVVTVRKFQLWDRPITREIHQPTVSIDHGQRVSLWQIFHPVCKKFMYSQAVESVRELRVGISLCHVKSSYGFLHYQIDRLHGPLGLLSENHPSCLIGSHCSLEGNGAGMENSNNGQADQEERNGRAEQDEQPAESRCPG